MRMLERAGLVPDPALQRPRRLSRRRSVPRLAVGAGEAPPAGHQRLPAQGRRHPELPVGAVARLDPASFVVLTATRTPVPPPSTPSRPSAAFRIERVPEPILFFPTPGAVGAGSGPRGRPRRRPGPARPRPPARPAGPPPGRALRRGPPRGRGDGPGRLPGARGRPGPRAATGRRSSISAGGYPAAEAAGPPPDAVRPVVEVPPGVDTERIVPLAAERPGRGPTRLGLPAEGPLVVSVSRLVPRKGMDVLIEAADRLAPSFPDLTVAIGRDGREPTACDAWSPGSPVRRPGARAG